MTSFRPTSSWRARLLPLAAGLVIGAAVTQLLHLDSGRVIDESRAVGTMRTTPGERSLEVDLGAEVGSLTLDRGEGALDAELRLVGKTSVTLAVEPEAGRLRLVSAAHAGGGDGLVATEGGKIVLRLRGPGLQRLSVAVPEGARRVRLDVATGAGIIVDRWVDVGPPGESP